MKTTFTAAFAATLCAMAAYVCNANPVGLLNARANWASQTATAVHPGSTVRYYRPQQTVNMRGYQEARDTDPVPTAAPEFVPFPGYRNDPRQVVVNNFQGVNYIGFFVNGAPMSASCNLGDLDQFYKRPQDMIMYLAYLVDINLDDKVGEAITRTLRGLDGQRIPFPFPDVERQFGDNYIGEPFEDVSRVGQILQLRFVQTDLSENGPVRGIALRYELLNSDGIVIAAADQPFTTTLSGFCDYKAMSSDYMQYYSSHYVPSVTATADPTDTSDAPSSGLPSSYSSDLTSMTPESSFSTIYDGNTSTDDDDSFTTSMSTIPPSSVTASSTTKTVATTSDSGEVTYVTISTDNMSPSATFSTTSILSDSTLLSSVSTSSSTTNVFTTTPESTSTSLLTTVLSTLTKSSTTNPVSTSKRSSTTTPKTTSSKASTSIPVSSSMTKSTSSTKCSSSTTKKSTSSAPTATNTTPANIKYGVRETGGCAVRTSTEKIVNFVGKLLKEYRGDNVPSKYAGQVAPGASAKAEQKLNDMARGVAKGYLRVQFRWYSSAKRAMITRTLIFTTNRNNYEVCYTIYSKQTPIAVKSALPAGVTGDGSVNISGTTSP